MTFHYDENIMLSWMKKSMLNEKQNFSMSILDSFCLMHEVVVSDMLSHYLAVLKRRKDLINLTQNPQGFDHHSSQRGGGKGEVGPCLTGIGEFKPELSRLSG